MRERGDELLAQVAAHSQDDAVQQLLGEFFKGYPIEKLRLLLGSTNENAVKAGAWIASELGSSVSPLNGDLLPLLDHPARYIRFFVIDAVLGYATAEHGEATAKAIRLTRDTDDAVRWKALNFVAKADLDQLLASLPFQTDTKLAELTTWLTNLLGSPWKRTEIVNKLDDQERLVRLFAATAAARVAKSDMVPLQHAAGSGDEEVSSFARDEMKVLAIK